MKPGDPKMNVVSALGARAYDKMAKVESKNILKKFGGWYTILKPEKLPSHVMKHTSAIEQSSKGEIRFKFKQDWKRYKKMLDRTSPE